MARGSLPRRPWSAPPGDQGSEPNRPHLGAQGREGSASLPEVVSARPQAPEALPGQLHLESCTTGCNPLHGKHPHARRAGPQRKLRGPAPLGPPSPLTHPQPRPWRPGSQHPPSLSPTAPVQGQTAILPRKRIGPRPASARGRHLQPPAGMSRPLPFAQPPHCPNASDPRLLRRRS